MKLLRVTVTDQVETGAADAAAATVDHSKKCCRQNTRMLISTMQFTHFSSVYTIFAVIIEEQIMR